MHRYLLFYENIDNAVAELTGKFPICNKRDTNGDIYLIKRKA